MNATETAYCFLAGTANARKLIPAPREYRGNMCGVRVPGLPAVPGGAVDPSLVLSWMIDRYSASDRQRIYAVWKAKGDLDVLVSWPDSQAFGHSAEQFGETCAELVDHGFRPCVFLSAKPTSSADIRTPEETLANILPVLSLLIVAGVAPRVCIGWELSLWLSPSDVQRLIDVIAPRCVAAGVKVYVHWQERYMSFPQPGQNNASFWNANIGKLTGVLLQRKLGDSDAAFLDWLRDCLERAAGNDFMPAVLIDGHGVDLIALELNAEDQFNGIASEAEGNRLGRLALSAPPITGPAGTARILGSGNGQ